MRVVAGAEDDLVEAVIADDIELAVDGHGHARLADIRAVVVVPGVHDGARRTVDLQDAAIRVFDGEEEAGGGDLAEGKTVIVGDQRAVSREERLVAKARGRTGRERGEAQ